MLEDKLLIFKFNRGNRQALRDIYEKYKDDLVTLAAALLIDASSAEDVVHDVFVSFIASAEKFRLTGSLKGYLATCVANNARNKIKANQRHNGVAIDDANPAAADSVNPAYRAIFGEESHRLVRALEQLPYEQREVIILHCNIGLKFREIAAQQNVSLNTIQGRYRYAMDKLRSMLDGQVHK
jgi:RNA polymerase sigma factor (sigma-70 family)